MSKRLIAVYGSLRKDQSLYNILRHPEYVRTTELKGYVMWDLGRFPTITKSRNPEHVITIDVLALYDGDFDIVMAIEIDAGYWLDYTNNQDSRENDDLPIWIYKDSQILHKHQIPIIESGDWLAMKALT